jgi:hypothetical protein
MDGKNKLKCCVGPHISQCQADRKRAAEEVMHNVASKRARTPCSGHIRPLTTHSDFIFIQIFTHHEYIYFR